MIGNVVRVTAAVMMTTNPPQALSTTATTTATADMAKLPIQYLDTALSPGSSTRTNRGRIVNMSLGAAYRPGVAIAVESTRVAPLLIDISAET